MNLSGDELAGFVVFSAFLGNKSPFLDVFMA